MKPRSYDMIFRRKSQKSLLSALKTCVASANAEKCTAHTRNWDRTKGTRP
jgi:hypothetical protein